MNEIYFGKTGDRYYLYLDPINFKIDDLIVNTCKIHCNEIIFDGIKSEIINNKSYSQYDFIELLNRNNSISEFDLFIDENIHVQNIWWNDLLLISNLEIINLFIHSLKPKLCLYQNKIIKKTPLLTNKLLSISNNIISKTSMKPNEFISYIKNSERYLQKELKIINSLEIQH
jgi:hypothetical protein